MTAFASPVVAWDGATGDDTPLIVLLHGSVRNWREFAHLVAGLRRMWTTRLTGPWPQA